MRVWWTLFFVLWPALGLAQDVGDAGTNVDAGVEADVSGESEEAEIAGRIEGIFDEIDGMSSVEIRIRRGVVTLDGEVESARLREDAGRIASSTEGVVYVQNRLKVTVDGSEEPADKTSDDERIEARLNAVFSSVQALKNVRARAESGIVHLEGTTLSSEATRRATELAESIEGVVFVDNQVEESAQVQDRLEPAWQKTREVTEAFVRHLPLFLLGLAVLLAFWFGSRFFAHLIPLRNLRDTPLAQNFMRQLIRWVIMFAGVFIVLEILGIASLVAAVMGTAGIAGIGLGFAFKDIVENYLAGFLLGTRQPFSQNDFVNIDGFEGKVVRLTSRETVLMTIEGNHLSIPNSLVFKSVMTNFTRNPRRRFDFVVGVHPEEDFKEVFRIGLETLLNTPGVMKDPEPRVLIDGFGDSTLNVRFFGWVNQVEHGFLAVRSEAKRRINEAMIANEMDLPEPMYRIKMADSEDDRVVRDHSIDHGPSLVSIEARDEVDDQIDEERAHTDERDLLQEGQDHHDADTK